MKAYVDGIGYVEVVAVESVRSLPPHAIFFNYDDEMSYYIMADDDAVYAVKSDKVYSER